MQSPSMPSGFVEGASMAIHGLKGRPELNGHSAICIRAKDGERIVVQLLSGEHVALKPENLKVCDPVAKAPDSARPGDGTPRTPSNGTTPTAAKSPVAGRPGDGTPRTPQMPSGFVEGAPVNIHGLKGRTELNGQSGTIGALGGERISVRLHSGEDIKIKPENLKVCDPAAKAPDSARRGDGTPRTPSDGTTPTAAKAPDAGLPPQMDIYYARGFVRSWRSGICRPCLGAPVNIHGLKGRTELNGQSGTIIGAFAGERFTVRLHSGEDVKIKPENLKMCDPAVNDYYSVSTTPTAAVNIRGFVEGAPVNIRGLGDHPWNGLLGTIGALGGERITVRLHSGEDVKIKPKNLKVCDPAVAKPGQGPSSSSFQFNADAKEFVLDAPEHQMNESAKTGKFYIVNNLVGGVVYGPYQDDGHTLGDLMDGILPQHAQLLHDSRNAPLLSSELVADFKAGKSGYVEFDLMYLQGKGFKGCSDEDLTVERDDGIMVPGGERIVHRSSLRDDFVGTDAERMMKLFKALNGAQRADKDILMRMLTHFSHTQLVDRAPPHPAVWSDLSVLQKHIECHIECLMNLGDCEESNRLLFKILKAPQECISHAERAVFLCYYIELNANLGRLRRYAGAVEEMRNWGRCEEVDTVVSIFRKLVAYHNSSGNFAEAEQLLTAILKTPQDCIGQADRAIFVQHRILLNRIAALEKSAHTNANLGRFEESLKDVQEMKELGQINKAHQIIQKLKLYESRDLLLTLECLGDQIVGRSAGGEEHFHIASVDYTANELRCHVAVAMKCSRTRISIFKGGNLLDLDKNIDDLGSITIRVKQETIRKPQQ